MKMHSWLLCSVGLAAAGISGGCASSKVFAKAGVSQYTGSAGRDSGPGYSWGAAFAIQPLGLAGVELAYEGARHPIDGSSGALVRHGASAMAKFGLLPLPVVHPFLAAGIGVSWVSIAGPNNQAYRADTLKDIPVFAGVEVDIASFTAGARVGYRHLLDASFAQGSGGGPGGMWEAQATAGVTF